MKVAEAIDGYVKMRDKKKAMQDRHKEELAPINENMRTIEVWLMREFNSQGVTQQKGASGATAFIQNNDSCSAPDKEAFINYVRDNDRFELLEIRPAKTVIREFMEDKGEVPPGIKYTQHDVIRIRR